MTPEYIMLKGIDISRKDARYAQSEIENMQYALEYAEPGYNDKPRKGILFANWNYFSKRAFELLEQYGYACEWSDEWSICDDCARAIRTSPDSYSWKASYWITEGSIVCEQCILEDPVEYLEAMENHPTRAVTLDIDLTSYGYVLREKDLENGFHPGQNDDPKKIYAKLRERGCKAPIIFKVDSVEQFDLSFSVYVKEEDVEEELTEDEIEYQDNHRICSVPGYECEEHKKQRRS